MRLRVSRLLFLDCFLLGQARSAIRAVRAQGAQAEAGARTTVIAAAVVAKDAGLCAKSLCRDFITGYPVCIEGEPRITRAAKACRCVITELGTASVVGFTLIDERAKTTI